MIPVQKHNLHDEITQFKKGLLQTTVAHTVAFHFGMQTAF